MNINTDQSLTLTVEQAAKLLGIGRSTAYELVHTGDIPSLRLGRRIVVPAAKLAHALGVDCLAATDRTSDGQDEKHAGRLGSGLRTEDAVEVYSRTLF